MAENYTISRSLRVHVYKLCENGDVMVCFSYNIINIHIRDRPEWYYKKNPLGKVPCLEEPDGSIVLPSLVIAEYIDDKYHDYCPLLPSDPYERAVQKQLIELVIGTVGNKVAFL